MTKLIVDTSVFVSALLSKTKGGGPSQVLQRWREGRFTLVMAAKLLEELVDKLYERGLNEATIVDLMAVIDSISLYIPGAYEATRLDKIDPDDNKFLAAAYESRADYLVSLDSKHLLPIKYYHGTQIVMPTIFLRLLKETSHDNK